MEAIIMACTITSLFLFAVLAIATVGFAFRSSGKGNQPVQRERTPAVPNSGDSVPA
jgi:hypothetical protein